LLHPNLQVVQGDICDSGLSAQSFDGIISLSTIEHIGLGAYGDSKSDLLSTAIAQIHRLLKPNGKFFMTAPYGISTVTELHRVFDSESLRTLLSAFEIEKLEFGRKINGKTWMSPVAEDSVNQLPSDPRTGAPSAVAMAVCVKRGD
jgi:SAM-dependent methyltransferase